MDHLPHVEEGVLSRPHGPLFPIPAEARVGGLLQDVDGEVAASRFGQRPEEPLDALDSALDRSVGVAEFQLGDEARRRARASRRGTLSGRRGTPFRPCETAGRDRRARRRCHPVGRDLRARRRGCGFQPRRRNAARRPHPLSWRARACPAASAWREARRCRCGV